MTVAPLSAMDQKRVDSIEQPADETKFSRIVELVPGPAVHPMLADEFHDGPVVGPHGRRGKHQRRKTHAEQNRNGTPFPYTLRRIFPLPHRQPHLLNLPNRAPHRTREPTHFVSPPAVARGIGALAQPLAPQQASQYRLNQASTAIPAQAGIQVSCGFPGPRPAPGVTLTQQH